MPGERDPIERARLLREAEEKRARRRHEGWESDPPESAEAWPGTLVREGRVGEGNPSSSPAKHPRGFRTGLNHIAEAVGGWSKRVAFLLGLWGTFSTLASVGFTYWFQAHIQEQLDARLAKQEASLRSIEFSSKVVELNVGNWAPRITKLEETQVTQGEAVASLRPTITMSKKREHP